MSDILCRWLNVELRLSKTVDPRSISKDFANGYLIGEVLHKYQLQGDFDMFLKSNTENSKLTNFTLMEPTLQLLGVSFNLSMAQAVMREQHGAATRLLYQLFILLQKKRRAGLTGTAMEAMQPAATACLHRVENDIYSEVSGIRLPQPLTSASFVFCRREIYDKSVMAHFVEEQKRQKVQEEMRLQDIEKHRHARRKQHEIMTRIQTAIIQIPKPPPNRTLKALEKQQQNRKKQEAQVKEECLYCKLQRPEELAQANIEYIQKIRQRLEEDAAARQQREKRRRRVLVEQLKAHEAQEEALREEQLVERLTRQSQLERRLAVQLMQLRQQKDVLRQNRVFRERQYQEQRLRDFQEALEREAALARQASLDHAEETRKEIEVHDRIATERAQARYRKHSDSCREILEQIVDLATKAGEYRLLTGNLIPAKLMREWKELMFCGMPLYDSGSLEELPADPTPEQFIEVEKQEILNNQDYDEYMSMTGEWTWPEEGETKPPPSNNNILGHVVLRLQTIVNPPKPDTLPPFFPRFTLKACVLGKLFSGKTTCLTRIANEYTLYYYHCRITAFQDTWPKLEKWFSGKQSILVRLNAEMSEDMLFRKVESILYQAMMQSEKGTGKLSIASSYENSHCGNTSPTEPLAPTPGSAHWVYVDEPLPKEIPEYLVPYWENVCNSYVTNVKAVMQNLRTEQVTLTLLSCDACREEFKQYLRRPDLKQEFVSQWQQNYNSIPKDMRDDEETKAELHQRLDDLRERLWDICDKRKEEAGQERAAIMCDGWLEDHTAVLINHFSTLMQVEVDRFQDSLRLLRDYYTGMYKQVLSEAGPEFTCIPLLDIVALEEPGTQTDKSKRQAEGSCSGERICPDSSEIPRVYSLETILNQMEANREGRIYICPIIKLLFCAVKVRVELVKACALCMVRFLHRQAEQAFRTMEELLGARFLSEMNSIDQLAEVVRHHIESAAKLQSELMLVCTDFFLNGDMRVVVSPPPPPRPVPLELPTDSTLTILQLEAFYRQLRKVAPTGVQCSTDFWEILQELTSLNMGTNALPDPWMHISESQLVELVSMLTQDTEMLDWRQFLLSAALPWPTPTLPQLLQVLARFKMADAGATGSLTEEQYLKVELWFPSERALSIPEDLSEPLPYDRLANLRKFFFLLFADPNSSPARVDYVTMLLYFAAHPDPMQGFVRALSVVMGQPLRHHSSSRLLKVGYVTLLCIQGCI
uniref:Sperm flagellar 2 n=1 Tax=Hucho hucho TaxID=62062 RepID=A0A4W5JKA8_9TELE